MKLLVALDRSSFAEEVLPPIAAIVAAGNAEVILATVVKATDVHETRTGPPATPSYVLSMTDFTGRLLPNAVAVVIGIEKYEVVTTIRNRIGLGCQK